MNHTLLVVMLGLCSVTGLVLIALGLPGIWLIVAAVVGAVVGVPVPVIGSVIGGFVGAFIGATLLEYSRSQVAGVAVRAGWGALLGRVAATAAKMTLGIVIAVVAVFTVLR